MSNGPSFGAWLKQQRKGLDLTQRDLADRVGCSAVAIEKIEAGQRRPSAQLAELLAAQLAVPVAEWPAFVAFARGVRPAPIVPPGLLGTADAPWRDATRPPTNLPAPLTGFIGRAEEAAEVTTLLGRPSLRLLTLIGPPGIGKTRLSIEVARKLLGAFPDGVFFVPLAPIVEPDLVPSAIAAAVGVREVPGQPLLASLKEGLREKQALLVLDNFEQVTAAAPLVGDLLEAAPGLKALVSSRAPLHLYGEHEFPVPPLALPDLAALPLPPEGTRQLAAYEAVALFVERAQAVQPTFHLTAETAPAVAKICVGLDGLPLAIELAAARVRAITPAAMQAQMAHRLSLLTDGPVNRPPRQQTLRGAIAWSHELLTDAERQLFRRLAVFQGGGTPDALEAVAGRGERGEEGTTSDETNDPLSRAADAQTAIPTPSHHPPTPIGDALASLVDKSLVREDEGGDARADTAWGAEVRFGMLETIREYASEQLAASGEAAEIRRRHAAYYLALALEAQPQLQKGPDQESWLERLEQEHDNLRATLRWALESGEPETALRLGGAIWKFWLTHGHLSEGRRWLAAALALPGATPAVRAGALSAAGNLAHSSGDYSAARTCYEESLAIRRALGDSAGIAGVLNNLALVAHTQGDFERVQALQEESLALKRERGDKWGIASSLGNLGIMLHDRGEYPRARALHEESLALRRELGDKLGIALALGNLGVVALAQGEYTAARALHEESLATGRELGTKPGIATALINLGEVARSEGRTDAALALYQESLHIYHDLGDKGGAANAQHNLAQARLQQGQIAEAGALFAESLQIRYDAGDKEGTAECLAGLGRLAWAAGEPAQAARLFGAADMLFASVGFRLHPLDQHILDQAKAAACAALGEAAWSAAWSAGQRLPPSAAIAEALRLAAAVGQMPPAS